MFVSYMNYFVRLHCDLIAQNVFNAGTSYIKEGNFIHKARKIVGNFHMGGIFCNFAFLVKICPIGNMGKLHHDTSITAYYHIKKYLEFFFWQKCRLEGVLNFHSFLFFAISRTLNEEV